eukprot:scaffold828_cov129-Skeletonema_dohrnii-CCMP3373.AAC.3
MSSHHHRSRLHFLLCLYYHSRDAITLAAISAIVVGFTDLSGTLDTESVPWKFALWLTGINPSTIVRVWQVMIGMLPTRTRKGTGKGGELSSISKKADKQEEEEGGDMSRNQKRFICHELIHTITGFYHIIPLQGLVWMAIINFPLWFAHLDLCMSEKGLLVGVGSLSSSTSPRKNMARSIDKRSHQVVQNDHDPLVVFSIMIYVFGVFFRGQSFLLSGAGVVIMSLPFTRRKAAFSVAVTVPPLVVLFALEHFTIMSEMETWHNAVHSLSHMALHVAVNSLFKHHVA